jgi:hypothetical protein
MPGILRPASIFAIATERPARIMHACTRIK